MHEGPLRTAFARMQTSIREGRSFSSAMAEYRQYFSEMMVSMVKAGEESGTMDLILQRVADFMEQRQAFRNRILSIMTYPILMAAVAVIVVIFILSFVAPNITKIFHDLSVTLPLPTRMLMAVSSFLRTFWPAIIVALIILAAALRRALRTPRGLLAMDHIRFRVPLLREIFLKTEVASFARTLGTLIGGGVEILESMTICQRVVFSPILQEEIGTIRDFVARGGSMSGGLQNSRMFPYLVTQLVNAGERSGNVAKMLDKVASMYEEEVSQKSTRLVTLLEPAMILFMGAIVGMIVLAVLLPIFEISQAIR
jgi:general secretion pathway protein F